ncbi:receptor-type tyrosine-protein phosphatase H-like, partial [Clupea harengus]|uniref:Receptor-type tyrosine-protein phosphatase H-like n=1 Tax=Clupea harengus TaxID=7950 RepID=A0A8M1KDD7_CLUHA
MNLRQLLSRIGHWTLIYTCFSIKISKAQSDEPHPIRNLTAETLNTTAIELKWDRPEDYQSTYRYQVQISGCTSPNRDASTSEEKIIISSLPPGTSCRFSIYVEVMNGTRGEELNISRYTRPETVQPVISDHTNNSITVSWSRPNGNVESFEVLLNSSSNITRSPLLNSSVNSYEFKDLSAGKIYTATVTTKSGPFSEESEVNTTATYPNPPGDITMKNATTNYIFIKWTPALLMDNSDGFNYTVNISSSSGTTDYSTKALNQTLTNLKSGTPHIICVRTTGPLGLQSESVCSAHITTKPYPISNLRAEPLNTTAMKLKWDQPDEYKDTYKGCGSFSYVWLTDLQSNSVWMFYISCHLGPETVQPVISDHTNNSITVSWSRPNGNVESFEVLLNSSSNITRSLPLNSSINSYEFKDLSAGKIYTATVTTNSGPFSQESEVTTNATYPNPPRDIFIKKKTTKSIFVEWAPAFFMDDSDGFNYTVIISSSSGTADYSTKASYQNLTNLPSGTPHVICLRTTGPLGLQSESVCSEHVTTRPESVKSVQVDIVKETYMRWKWAPPPDSKDGYYYRVNLTNELDNINLTDVTNDLKLEFKQLIPGARYNITVTTFTSDGTDGSPVNNSACTDTSGLTEDQLKCVGKNHTPVLELEWKNPKGHNSGFKIKAKTNAEVNVHLGEEKTCNETCVYRIESDLTYSTEYSVTIWTVGCGKSGMITTTCKTGVTVPPVVSDNEKVEVRPPSHNKVELILDPIFLNSSNGPILEYGVLVSQSENPTFKKDDLVNSYDDWQKHQDLNYLAVLKKNEIKMEEISIIVGEDSPLREAYRNGPLTPTKTYSFAIVTCTALQMKTDKHVDIHGSICSISGFYKTVYLKQDPLVITTAVGATCGILTVCLCIAIAVFIFLK